VEMLGGLLAGVTASGVLMAIFQSNAGGAWDNAKKMIEADGRKGTEAHKAAVVGDTVGDPFKDTSGPSLNILLKLMSVVALVIAPSIALPSEEIMTAYIPDDSIQKKIVIQEVKVNMMENEDGTYKAVVTTVTTTNEETSTSYENFTGTEAEVKAHIEAFKNRDNTYESSTASIQVDEELIVK